MKVFISYSTEDRKSAESLFDDVAAAGDTVFQFGRTETFGKPSWEQVIDWINQSDAFIVLLSKSALASRPVKEEIEQAHYSYINREKPDKLIPALIEPGAKPPTLIERFTTVDLVPYERGITRLMSQLGLQRRVTAGLLGTTLREPLPDLSWVFQEYKKKHPEPTLANQWSTDAEKIVANYNLWKPAEIAEPERAFHLDSILTRHAGKTPSKKLASIARYDSLLLKGALDEPTESAPLPSFKISDFLLKAEVAPKARPFWQTNLIGDFGLEIPAPTLKADVQGARVVLTWPSVPGAKSYVIQRNSSATFTEKTPVVYEGPAATFTDTPGEPDF